MSHDLKLTHIRPHFPRWCLWAWPSDSPHLVGSPPPDRFSSPVLHQLISLQSENLFLQPLVQLQTSGLPGTFVISCAAGPSSSPASGSRQKTTSLFVFVFKTFPQTQDRVCVCVCYMSAAMSMKTPELPATNLDDIKRGCDG